MKKLIYLVLPMIVCGELSAQQLGFQINVGVPHDEFKEKTDAVGVGGKINLLFPIAPDNPISIGGDLNYIIYGFNSQREDLRAEIRSGNTIIETIEIPLRIENTNSILGFHGMMRVDPFDGPVRPYLQGLFGFRYISTNTKIIDRSWNNRWSSEDDNVIVRRTNLEDFTFSYGFGGGLMFQINGNVYLDFTTDFLKGGRANFYDAQDTKNWRVDFVGSSDFNPNTVSGDDLEFNARPKNSKTDMLSFSAGVTFRI